MSDPNNLQKTALRITKWVGSPISIAIHTMLFLASFLLSYFGYVPFDRMLLVLTTIVSLEAIYLSIFIQMTINYTTTSIEEVGKDIDEIQVDIDEMQEDVEEIQEDVGEMTEEEVAEEKAEAEARKTLSDIQSDLKKLMEDIERLKR